ncbi:hypothetical protein BH09VER1_BH09VER1_31530 [soil metagenome]
MRFAIHAAETAILPVYEIIANPGIPSDNFLAVKTPRLRLFAFSLALLFACRAISYAADGGNGTVPATPGKGSDTNTAAKADKKPHTILLLDGSVLFGKVELTDDYTLKVSSDSGIQKIALAMLGEPDFKKYGFSKDRSQDGRFWSERQGAVSDQQKTDDAKGDKSKVDKSQLEISLADLIPFQPLIASYQKDNPKKDDSNSDQKDKTASTGGTQLPFTPLFSQPGMSSLPTAPLSGLGTGAGLPSAPGSGLIPTPGAGIPGLPVSP